MICLVLLFSFGLIRSFSGYNVCCIICLKVFFFTFSLQSGKFKPVIKKAMVELDGKNTTTFSYGVTRLLWPVCAFFCFPKSDLLWHHFQVHLSRSLHRCEMSGPSRTDTLALVCRYETARNDHIPVSGPIQFR